MDRPDGNAQFTVVKWFVALLSLGLVVALFIPNFGRISERSPITIGIYNCRQILVALHLYAADYNGAYPKGDSANQVFRQLFLQEILDNESIFGCPNSPYQPDREIGRSPTFPQAIVSGENHWAIIQGLNNSRELASIPAVFETPVNAEWPPRWNADAAGQKIKGRSWAGGKIIIGLNDTSVSLHSLTSRSGSSVGLAPANGESQNLFEKAIHPIHFPVGKVLDVE
jgi:hypothetical protein